MSNHLVIDMIFHNFSAKEDSKEEKEEVRGWSMFSFIFILAFILVVGLGGTYAYDLRKSGGIFSPKMRSQEPSEDFENPNPED